MQEIIEKKLTNVYVGFDLLIEQFSDFISELDTKATNASELKQLNAKISEHIEQIENIRDSWNNYLSSRVELAYIMIKLEDDFSDYELADTSDRTSYCVVNKEISITAVAATKTVVTYTYKFPIELFKDFTNLAIDQIDKYKQEYTTVKMINLEMINRIQQETNYQKCPNQLIRSTFNVLIKESMFIHYNNTKSKYMLNKTPDEIREWMDKKLK